MLIVGGQRSLTGAVVGAVAISAIVEALRQLEVGVDLGAATLSVPLGAQELGVAVVMLLILIFRPSGHHGRARDLIAIRDSQARAVPRRAAPERRETGPDAGRVVPSTTQS